MRLLSKIRITKDTAPVETVVTLKKSDENKNTSRFRLVTYSPS